MIGLWSWDDAVVLQRSTKHPKGGERGGSPLFSLSPWATRGLKNFQ
ncbi:hypothetical protein [Neobacillus sp. YIM B06451]|nr:hypothetical protein [Neobacillus sp. YIM B06451]